MIAKVEKCGFEKVKWRIYTNPDGNALRGCLKVQFLLSLFCKIFVFKYEIIKFSPNFT